MYNNDMKNVAKRHHNVSTVTDRGQVSIPAGIRHQFGIKSHSKLAWIALPGQLTVMVVPDNPIEALEGCMKGTTMLEGLLEERRRDKERE